MAKIVLTWELGADLGHISRLDALALRLQRNGHTVMLVLSRLSELRRLYPKNPPPYDVLSAPRWADKPVKLSREPANLTEILLAIGYHKYAALEQCILEWRNTFSSLSPDLVIFDYAPTAQLAARDGSYPKISLDDPFTCPPHLFPLPAFDDSISVSNLQISDNKIVGVINQVLDGFNLRRIQYAHEIFHTQKSFLLSIHELDPFADLRESGLYIGPINTAIPGSRMLNWISDGRTKKIFAYLKPTYSAIRELLVALAQSGAEVKVFLPDAESEFIGLCTDYGFDISTTVFDLSDLKQADLVICHGGHTTVLQSVLNGLPLLIIPLQQEQLATARKCIANGLGLGLGPCVTDNNKITSLLQQLLYEPLFRSAAQACATKYHYQLAEPALDIIAQHVETLL
jgi:hypothetical protein